MQEKLKKSVWDYLFYASIGVLTIWLILKVTGIINTPVWLEYGVPLGAFIVSFLTFHQGFMDKIFLLTTSIARLESNDAKLEVNFARLEEHLIHLDKDIEIIKTNLQK